MKTTDQLAAQAARDVHFTKTTDLGTSIIKSAIEEALTDQAMLKVVEEHEAICPLSRESHASERLAQDIWDRYGDNRKHAPQDGIDDILAALEKAYNTGLAQGYWKRNAEVASQPKAEPTKRLLVKCPRCLLLFGYDAAMSQQKQ